MKEGQVNIEDLDAETRTRLGLNKKAAVDKRVIALGKVLNHVGKLNVQDAGWVLRTALRHVTGERAKAGKNGKKVKGDGATGE